MSRTPTRVEILLRPTGRAAHVAHPRPELVLSCHPTPAGPFEVRRFVRSLTKVDARVVLAPSQPTLKLGRRTCHRLLLLLALLRLEDRAAGRLEVNAGWEHVSILAEILGMRPERSGIETYVSRCRGALEDQRARFELDRSLALFDRELGSGRLRLHFDHFRVEHDQGTSATGSTSAGSSSSPITSRSPRPS